jgi:hypothetical protein
VTATWRPGPVLGSPAGPRDAEGPRRSVNALLTSGVAVACYYAACPDAGVARPHCQGLASVLYGRIALCHECDLRRSAVGKGVAPVQLPDPGTLAAVMAAKDACQGAEADLANAVALARRAGQPWSAIGTVLDISRQAAQQRFSRCAGTHSAKPPGC